MASVSEATSIETRPLEDWIEYDTFIHKEFDTKLQTKTNKNANIEGLSCDRNTATGRINYQYAEFNSISEHIKPLYSLSNFTTSKQSFTKVLELSEATVFNSPYYLFFPKEYTNVENLQQQKDYFQTILYECRKGKRALSLAYVKDARKGHVIATVFWYDNETNTYICAIYDPMFYTRDTANYTWAVEQAKQTINLLSTDIDFEFINLGDYCAQTEKGLHCPQYMVNAEFCSMYSLYFLFLYAKGGYPIDKEGLRRTVEGSFIVPPLELKRNPCVATNKFRVVMISFIYTVLTLFVNKVTEKNYELFTGMFDNYNTILNDGRGFDVFHPDIKPMFDMRVSEANSIANRGKTQTKTKTSNVPLALRLVQSTLQKTAKTTGGRRQTHKQKLKKRKTRRHNKD